MKIYLVGTPIGNLGDMSPRAVETLKNADFIAAEDTRVTLKLLTHFGIQKPLVSCYEHNIRRRSDEIIARVLNGETCAVVTDAGMPCISDPGEELVRLCAEHGIEVVAVPGPTAAMSALAISGLPTGRFSFEGFLSVTKRSRNEQLEEIKNQRQTLIFYEAPHKLKQTLKDLLEALGDRRISLCREITKVHEEVIRGTISEMIALYETENPRGEYVLVVEGASAPVPTEETLDDAVNAALELIAAGEKPSEACRRIAAKSAFSKSLIYKGVLERQES